MNIVLSERSGRATLAAATGRLFKHRLKSDGVFLHQLVVIIAYIFILSSEINVRIRTSGQAFAVA